MGTAMRAEFLKIRYLPTPLWTGVFMGACFLIGLVFSVLDGVGQEEAVLDISIGLPAAIVSIVLGAWIVGVEFGQNTLRRLLSTDPRRTRLAFSKLAVCLAVVAGATVVLWLAGMLIFSLAGSGHETTIDSSQALRNGAAVLLTNVIYAVIAMGLAWVTRSMAGGMTVAFVFFFVIDSVFALLPNVGDYSLGAALGTLDEAIRGTDQGIFGPTESISTEAALIALAAWVIVVFGAGLIRTENTEVK